jgi:hypothetical protein
MRIDYCDWVDCPKQTRAAYSVKNLTTGVTLYLCAKHFREFRIEEASEQ